MLYVSVHGVRHLPKMDMLGKCDPVVQVLACNATGPIEGSKQATTHASKVESDLAP